MNELRNAVALPTPSSPTPRHARSPIPAGVGSESRAADGVRAANRPYLVVKRVWDVGTAAILLAALSPLFIAVAALIKIESRGPVLFRQLRRGRAGAVFTIYKFRTMRTGADAERAALRDANKIGAANFKLRNDPRITRLGKYLRKFSIDELPQLLNVLKGDMSLVGPRPFPLDDFAPQRLDREEARYWSAERHVVRPGLTGLWQVSGRNNLPFDQLIALDLIYVQNVGLLLDAEILLRTLPAVVTNKGAY